MTAINRPDSGAIGKPAEWIDVRPAVGSTLSLAARRYFNLMIKEAGARIGEPIRHRILKRALRGSHKGSDHLAETLDELAHTYVRVPALSSRGEVADALPQLVELTIERSNKADAWVEFEFPAKLRNLLADSQIYASLNAQAVMAFRSKYSLILYELGCQITNKREPVASFKIHDLRDYVNVPQDGLSDFGQFRYKVLEVAKAEIDQLADFTLTYEVVKNGRTVTAVNLWFWQKSSDAASHAKQERERHSIGRKARREGKVEKVDVTAVLPAPSRSSGIPGVPPEDIDRLMKQAKRPQDVIRRAMESEKREPGSGRNVIQAELKD